MSSPEETQQAADLIERLLTDAAFRGEFRRDPVKACESFGLTELAAELGGGGSAKALYTLELRQSMSSLAGVIMAAAAEGIGALELAGYARGGDKQVAGVVNEALSRHSIKAISQAQMQAVEQGPGGGAAADDQDANSEAAVGDDVPADDASADAGCGSCGDPTGVCGHTPGDGCPHCGDAAGACGHGEADCSTCGHHGSGCGHGVACAACGDASGVCGHTPGKGCPSCGDTEGACGHGAAACAVCGDSAGGCNHSHADRKAAAGLAHDHAGHSHAGHAHAHSHGNGQAQGGGGPAPAARATLGATAAAEPKQAPQPVAAPAQEEAPAQPVAAPVQEEAPAQPAPSHQHSHAGHDHSHAGHDHGPSLAEVGGPAVTPSAELATLLENPNLELPAAARADLASGRVDPRLVSMLTSLTKEHKIGLSVVISGHDQFTSGGSVSNHFVGRGLDIASVDGEIVRSNSIASRELAEALVDLPQSIRPTEVGTPWAINAPGFFTDGGHQDHLHIAFDGAAPEGFVTPVTPAPAAAAAAAVAAASPAQVVAEPGSGGPASGVFQAAQANGAEARTPTVGAMPAVEQQPAPAPAPAQVPAEPAEPIAAAAPSEAPIALPDVSDVYPGDQAPKEQIAAWMARQAHKAGLPGELPIMASLVESRMSNINFGDADSIGYFQMRTSIWDQGEYAGYGEKPELQLKWFIDHALHEKQKRVARGETAFLKDSSKWGQWIADVERPAEQYRGRYQERLAEARELLGSAQKSAPPVAPDATLDAAVAGAELDAAPQAKKALAVAKEYLGTPYQWGGATPETNFDCSGLMQWAYKQVGMDIPRVTYDQVNVGEHIQKVDQLEAGDLVFFQDSSGDMHHVGMYIGEHKFIHAPHTGDVVKVSSLDEPYYQEQFAGGRRMVAAVPEAGAAPAAPAAPVAPGAVPGAEVRAAPPEPPSAGRESGVFAGVGESAETAKTPTIQAIPVVEQAPAVAQAPAVEPAAAVAEAVAAPAAPAAGGPIAPVAPEDMANTNEGGKLHASEFHVHDAEGAPGAEGNLHAGYDLFTRAGAPVRSPVSGTIVEVKASRGNTGQIFGGVVKVRGEDGRVWVFRHVDPKGVVEGGTVTAGQEIASVTEWTGGAHHAHIELWKTLDGGYNVSNMEDPYAELQKAYAGGGTELPPDPHQHGSGDGHDHAGHSHEAGELAAAGPAVPASAQLQALLENPNLELPAPARADLASGRVDPRLVAMLSELTKEHRVGLSVIISGHDKLSASGSVSNHFVGRGLDIASVDGEIVRASSIKSRELAEALVDLPESIRPTEVGAPWSINAPGFFTDGGHQDHLHIAFDDPPPEGFAPPAAPAPASAAPVAPVAPVAPAEAPVPSAQAPPVAPAEAPPVAPAEAPPAPEPVAEGSESGVFAGVPDPNEHSGSTVQFMQAVHEEVKAKIEQPPEPEVEVAKLAEPVGAGALVDAYPGDQAPKEQIAAWMAARAQAAGVPPELPIMASLVESRMSNINFGDADSIGFFQMRTSIWDQGEYAGYGTDPEKQIKWFLDHAVHEKEKRVADGYTNFLTDESKWGDWVADVERPAEQYRGRYQERLAEAKALLAKGGQSPTT